MPSLPEALRDIWTGWETLLFPASCRGCGGELGGGGPRWLCDRCRQRLARGVGPAWQRSALLPGVSFPSYASLPYEGPAGAAVRLLKYERRRRIEPLLGEALVPLAVAVAREHFLDCVVPVPLHPRRFRERGFNQSALLARKAAGAGGLPFFPEALVRVRDTRPQASLQGQERRLNVAGAFRAGVDLRGRRVLLVDDVITTGATAEECRRALLAAGAAAVVGCAVAGQIAGTRG